MKMTHFKEKVINKRSLLQSAVVWIGICLNRKVSSLRLLAEMVL